MSEPINLKNQGLGTLKQIAESLWDEMEKEVKRNGYSDLTLNLEGCSRGIRDIIEINNIRECSNL